MRPALALAVLAAIVAPVAMATAQTADTSAAKSKAAKQIKALKKQTAALLSRLSALEARVGNGGGGGGSAPQVPTTLPPSGPAGGDLTAAYPDPQIRASSIISADIAPGAVFAEDIHDSTVTGFDVADRSVGRSDLGFGSVGAEELGSIVVVKSGPNEVSSGGFAANEIRCPPHTRLLSGTAELTAPPSRTRMRVIVSAPRMPPPGQSPDTWEVYVQNATNQIGSVFATAVCFFP
jgi:hypothetical protein